MVYDIYRHMTRHVDFHVHLPVAPELLASFRVRSFGMCGRLLWNTISPIGSMYAIYGNIYHQYTPNVSIYTIHGSYGSWNQHHHDSTLIQQHHELICSNSSSSPSLHLEYTSIWLLPKPWSLILFTPNSLDIAGHSWLSYMFSPQTDIFTRKNHSFWLPILT